MRRLCLCLMFCLLLTACFDRQIPDNYVPDMHGVLVGKIDFLVSGIFYDNVENSGIRLYRLNPNNSRTFIKALGGSELEVTVLEPGIYALDNTRVHGESRISASIRMWTTFFSKPDYAPLFTEDFWQLPEHVQADMLHKIAPDCFGVMRVGRGEHIYYGEVTLDPLTTKSKVMFVVHRNHAALAKVENQIDVRLLKDKDWLGPGFLLGKIRESRHEDLNRRPSTGENP